MLSNDISKNPGPQHDNFNILFSNINSISADAGARFADLRLRLKTEDIHIAAVCETGSYNNVEKWNIDGYHKLSQDLYNSNGRGMMLFVKESVVFKPRHDLEDDIYENIWLEIFVSHRKIIFGSLYRSPSQSAVERDKYFKSLDDNLNKIDLIKETVIFGGDFNSRSQMWWQNDINTPEGNKLYDLSVKHSLTQCVRDPTRITSNSRSCLDLLFTNSPGIFNGVSVSSPISGSDHRSLTGHLLMPTTTESPSFVRRQWKYDQADIDGLNNSINTYNWENIFSIADPHEMARVFTNVLYDMFVSYIPHHDKVVKTKDKPWFNERIKHEINLRDKYHKKFSRKNTTFNYNRFKIQEGRVADLINKAKDSYRDNLCDSLNTNRSNTKDFWTLMKKLLGNKFNSHIPTIECNGSIASNDSEKANLFLKSFLTKFSRNLDINYSPDFPLKTQASLSSITVTRDLVRKLINDLDPSKGGGDDGITNRMLKLAQPSIDKPLCNLFKILIECSIFPDCWKTGTILPIFKNKGLKTSISNYRPVTLLNSLSKLFERVIYSETIKYVIQNNLIYQYQSGFIKGHDTQKQLIHIVNMLKSRIDQQMEIRGVFLDMEGAFDAIPHFLLVRKLRSFGFSVNVLNLFESYLYNRSLRVKINSFSSDWSEAGIINSGVPQGSILGPLLFLLYINDIHEVVEFCSIYLYADDTCLFLPVGKDDDLQAAHRRLQSDLQNLSLWADKWKMTFKAQKSNEIIFRSNRNCRRIHPNIYISGDMIPRNSFHKHLGLFLDETLTFEYHINYITSKCNNLLNPLKPLSHLLNSKHLETIYNLFVLPHLEYGAIIFDCSSNYHLAKLDRVHYRAALLVSGCIHGSNSKKLLQCLGWLDLTQRRNEKKACLMYDNENNLTPTFIREIISPYRNAPPQRITRFHRNFSIPTYVKSAFLRTTIPTSIKIWESLPENIRNRYSRNSFKFNLRKYFLGTIDTSILTKNLDLSRNCELLLNRTRCDLIFNSHFYSHNFTTIDSPACPCGSTSQNTCHVFLCCPLLTDLRLQLFDDLARIDCFFTLTFPHLTFKDKLHVLLNGSERLTPVVNRSLISLSSSFLENALPRL